MTAQSIITNANKSLYVTIGTSSFQKIQQPTYRPFSSLGKYIQLISSGDSGDSPRPKEKSII